MKEGIGTFIAIVIFFGGLAILSLFCAGAVSKESNAEITDLEKNIIKVEDMQVLPENEGKLVLVSGTAKKDEELVDADFNITVNTILLYRKVEMYQWKEVETWNKEDKEYKYTYSKVWTENLIDDTLFKYKHGIISESHINPKNKPYESKLIYGTVELGEFKLSNDQIKSIKTDSIFEELSTEVATNMGMVISEHYYTTVDKTPEIGDIRISFLTVDSTKYKNITVLAKQKDNTFEEFKVDNSTPAGKMTNDVYDGIWSQADIIASRNEEGEGYKTFFHIVAVILMIPIILAAKNTFAKKTENY